MTRATTRMYARTSHLASTRARGNVARLLSRAATLLTLGALASAPTVGGAQSSTVLSLGDAARLAARQNGAVEIAAARVGQATARAQQRRGALFPEDTDADPWQFANFRVM